MKDEELAKDTATRLTLECSKRSLGKKNWEQHVEFHMRNPFMSPIQSLYVPSHVTSSWLIKLETPVAVVSNVGC